MEVASIVNLYKEEPHASNSEIAKAEAIAVGLIKRKRSDFFSPS